MGVYLISQQLPATCDVHTVCASIYHVGSWGGGAGRFFVTGRLPASPRPHHVVVLYVMCFFLGMLLCPNGLIGFGCTVVSRWQECCGTAVPRLELCSFAAFRRMYDTYEGVD
jgi:hypothetical protein